MQPQLSTGLRSFTPEDPGSWRHLIEVAQAADEAGVDRLTVSDHVAFGEQLEDYANPALGGQRGGVQPTSPDGYWLDPLTVIAHLTSVTTRVRFGTNILLAALRRPLVLAKVGATIDVLSGGRLDIGIGIGWQLAEYEAAGLPYQRRGRLLDHTIEVCQTLWRNRVASYDGEGVTFSNIHQMPKPVQAGGVPIWVSGTVNPRAMRRLARYGSGWIPWGPDAADIASGIERMREAVAGFGRDPAELGVVGRLPSVLDDAGALDLDATMAAVPDLVAAGVTDVRGGFPVSEEREEATEQFSAIVARFREAAA